MIEHDNITGWHSTREGMHGDVKPTLVVHTDLDIDGASPDYDIEKMNALIRYVSDFVMNSEHYEELRIVNLGGE